MDDAILLKIEHLSAGYGAIQVLWDINIELRFNEIVCIVGANGAGKSTFLNTILGSVPLWQGTINFLGEDVGRKPSPQRVKMGIGFAPEGRHLFYGLTVEDNLLMGAFQRKMDHSVKEDLEFVYGLFSALRDFRKRLAGNLSGGEQQMCAIGRALMAGPKLLVIDELSLGLAPVIVDDLIDILSSLAREKKIAILMVEQDVQVALDLADRGYVIEAGAITMSDTSENLAADAHIMTAYLGA